MLPLNVFIPTERGLKELWRHFDEHRDSFPGLPDDIVGFIVWICASDAMTFLIGPSGSEVGCFVFTGIIEGDSAWCHPFVWDKRAIAAAHEDLVEAAQAACVAIMRRFNLHRLNGSAPETNGTALRFAKRVGFVQEGVAREALPCGEGREHAVLTGMLSSDLQTAIQAHQRAKMGEKEK